MLMEICPYLSDVTGLVAVLDAAAEVMLLLLLGLPLGLDVLCPRVRVLHLQRSSARVVAIIMPYSPGVRANVSVRVRAHAPRKARRES